MGKAKRVETAETLFEFFESEEDNAGKKEKMLWMFIRPTVWKTGDTDILLTKDEVKQILRVLDDWISTGRLG